MPQEQLQTAEAHETKEVLDVVFPAGNEPAETVQPGKHPLHLPAPTVAAQCATVLRFHSPFPTMGSNQLDSVLFREPLVEPVRVVSFVADKPRRELVKEAST